MLSALVIVFREILEMSLVISVLLAATKGAPKRSQWIILGMLIGALCAVALASATGVLTFYLSDEAMIIFKRVILLIADRVRGAVAPSAHRTVRTGPYTAPHVK